MVDLGRFEIDGVGGNIKRTIKSMQIVHQDTLVSSLGIDPEFSIALPCNMFTHYRQGGYQEIQPPSYGTVGGLVDGGSTSGGLHEDSYPQLIVEFYPRYIKSKQQGGMNAINGEADISISEVVASNCLVIGGSSRLSYGDDYYFVYGSAKVEIKDNNTLKITGSGTNGRNSGFSGVFTSWVCLEFVGGVLI